jgi:hypothetical protein
MGIHQPLGGGAAGDRLAAGDARRGRRAGVEVGRGGARRRCWRRGASSSTGRAQAGQRSLQAQAVEAVGALAHRLDQLEDQLQLVRALEQRVAELEADVEIDLA